MQEQTAAAGPPIIMSIAAQKVQLRMRQSWEKRLSSIIDAFFLMYQLQLYQYNGNQKMTNTSSECPKRQSSCWGDNRQNFKYFPE